MERQSTEHEHVNNTTMSSARYRKPYSASSTVRSSQPDPPTNTRDESRIRVKEVGEHPILAVLRNVILVIVLNFLLSYYITSTFFWNYDFRLLRRRYISFVVLKLLHKANVPVLTKTVLLHLHAVPESSPIFASTFFTFTFPRIFSDATLALYNGSDPTLPIYVGLNGSVYDVSDNSRTYGPAGPYNHFAGRDAARAFVTGCFTTDLTHDLRGLDPVVAETDIAGWKAFFANSARYWYVGDVIHLPITGPPPGECQRPKWHGS
ncbi:cytochrome b5-like heme/steroid binding domain-containing protein [Lipomyces kononenkoae]|uniref:Cytochrome b5-like heme/steroid binding domain-containing protein n=1 Tax=Lipomyces kononenkoae TaxID=34357 RepID=A0ACC3T794_LIPKO